MAAKKPETRGSGLQSTGAEGHPLTEAEFLEMVKGQGYQTAGGIRGKVLENGECVFGTWVRFETRQYLDDKTGETKPGRVYVVKQSDGSIRGVGGAKILDSLVDEAIAAGLVEGCQVAMRRADEDLAPKVRGRNGAGDYSFHWRSHS